MKKWERTVRVSVIESELLMRQIMATMMRRAEGIDLAGVSVFTDEIEALRDVKRQTPDMLMLGVPTVDSEEMLFFKRVRSALPHLPVVLLTTRSKEGGRVAITGLRLGAADFITKPDKRNGLILATQHFRKRVFPIVRATPRINGKRIGQLNKIELPAEADPSVFGMAPGSHRASPLNYGIISVQGCLGAIPTLFELVSRLPSQLPVPVVIVQHMPKIFTEELALQLDNVTSLHVREAKNNSLLLPGQVYIAPGGYHSIVRHDGSRHVITLHRGAKIHRCRPSSDLFLRSAVQAYLGRVLGIFLSGGGSDGIEGARDIIRSGGHIILEDSDSTILSDLVEEIKLINAKLPSHAAQDLAREIINNLHTDHDREPYPMTLKDRSTGIVNHTISIPQQPDS